MMEYIMTGSPLMLKLNGEPVFLFNDNIGRIRVAQKTNSLHTEPLPLVRDEGQQPDKHYQLKTKVSDSICPVVEISFSAGNKRFDIKTCTVPCSYLILSKAA